MEENIRKEIIRFVSESRDNRFPESDDRYFDEPLVGFAAADDPLFLRYKEIIGDFHLTPQELMAEGQPGQFQGTVISWVLPITSSTRASNRNETRYPSRQWAETRSFGEDFNCGLRRHMEQYLTNFGYQALAPQLHPAWRAFPDSPVGIASSWSERHAAYACGLGTFSLSDALITQKGIAHRCGSVITDLKLTPSSRHHSDHRLNCLYFREGSCGLCMTRCPVGAITPMGHDKVRCRELVYGEAPKAVGEHYRVSHTGCGLCQTKVPCEACIPQGRVSVSSLDGGD